MTDLAERYVEQLTTTAETVRRRFISYYDGVVLLGQRMAKAAERTKEVVEPASFDLRDHVTTAMAAAEPVTTLEKDFRYTIVEMYLGLSVIMTGLSCGLSAGALALGPLLEKVFYGYMEFTLLVSVPIYVYLNIRKSSTMDDTERRTLLFGMVLSVGILAGHLMPSFVSMAPAVHFVPPLVLALLMDNELIVTPLSSMDRFQFLAISSAFSVVVSSLLGAISIGYVSFALLLATTLHVALLSLHLQLVVQAQKDKMFGVGESMFGYVVGVFAIQLLTTAVFGVSPVPQPSPQ